MLQAPVAGDVEFDPVTDDLAGDIFFHAPHQAFNRGGLELPDVSARDADGVVVVFNAGQAVPGVAIFEVEPAYDTDLHEKFERPEDGRPAHPRQFIDDLLGGEALLLAGQDPHDGAPWGRGAVTSVFDCGQNA